MSIRPISGNISGNKIGYKALYLCLYFAASAVKILDEFETLRYTTPDHRSNLKFTALIFASLRAC